MRRARGDLLLLFPFYLGLLNFRHDANEGSMQKRREKLSLSFLDGIPEGKLPAGYKKKKKKKKKKIKKREREEKKADHTTEDQMSNMYELLCLSLRGTFIFW